MTGPSSKSSENDGYKVLLGRSTPLLCAPDRCEDSSGCWLGGSAQENKEHVGLLGLLDCEQSSEKFERFDQTEQCENSFRENESETIGHVNFQISKAPNGVSKTPSKTISKVGVNKNILREAER